jgi:nucleoside phosphorylase
MLIHGKLTIREILEDSYLLDEVGQVVGKSEDALKKELVAKIKKGYVSPGDPIEDVYGYIPYELRRVTVKDARTDEDHRKLIQEYSGDDSDEVWSTLMKERTDRQVLLVWKGRWQWPQPETDSADEADATVVILTALEVEFEAVRNHLTEPQEDRHRRGSIYEVGTYQGKKLSFRVVLKEIGPRNTGAAAEIERAIEQYEPDYVLFVGVAGGIKDVSVGDVVCASKVYGYESGKETSKGFRPRPVAFVPSAALLERSRAVKRAHNRAGSAFRIHEGAIAAGDKVVASSRSATAQLIRANYGDALAIAMEELGFLEGAHKSNAEAMIIRGISDLLDGKSRSDKTGSQKLASENAALVAFRLLDDLET